MSEFVVLGAGIAGISAAYHAQKVGCDCTIFEAKSQYGGLLNNFSMDGFRFDYAVHLSFTNNEYIRSLFDKTSYYIHYPEPYNFEQGLWLKHPVQNNLFPLTVEDKILAIQGFIDRPELSITSDYEQWLIQQYGSYIAKRFPLPYTKKYWTVDADRLSTDWIGNRMYRPALDEVLFGAMSDETPNTYYAHEMRYPRQGGYLSFIEPIAKECIFQMNKQAIYVNTDKKYIEFTDGTAVYYNNIVSTIPLPELIKMMDGVPSHIKRISEDLWATSAALVSVGFNCIEVPKHLWFYIYDEDIAVARAYSPSIKSPDNVPYGCSSLQFEIYYSQYKPLVIDNDGLIEHVLNALDKMRIASKNDIIVADCRRVPYANVVFEKGMISKRNVIIKYLNELGIYTAGRFGEWDYLWSDQSLLSGKATIEQILDVGKKHEYKTINI